MRRLTLYILAVIVALVTVVAGCVRMPRYDGRLAQADSLMHDNPDSALALLEELDGAALTTKGDSAYRDLLLTQARYRCYVTATSDSAINRALAYYRLHPKEREKLTRAYIYKGAVMEELNHPDSAMLYYKHAEAVADTADYFNLGYINLRIADLFLNEVAEDNSVFKRLHQAVSCFKNIRDTTLLISALGKLGVMCGANTPDSAKSYLWRAITLARQFDSTLQYTNESRLAGIYLFQKEYPEANQLAMDVVRHGQEYCIQNQYYSYAAMSFIKMGMIDSAKYVMGIMPQPMDEVDSMTFYNLSAEISKAEGKMEQYGNNLYRSNKVESDILLSSRKGELMVIDSEFEHQQSEYRNTVVIKRNRWIFLAAGALLILLSLLAYWQWRRNKTFRQEKAAMEQDLESAMAQLEDLKHNATDTSVTSLVSLRLSAIQELYHSIRMRTDDENRQRRIIPFSSFIKSMHDRRAFLSLELKESFWEKMSSSVDGEYNGIFTYVKTRYPELTQKELDYFCLLCSGISPQIIMLCMNITNAKTVTNYRTQIMKKMGHNMTFEEFIEKYMNGDI